MEKWYIFNLIVLTLLISSCLYATLVQIEKPLPAYSTRLTHTRDEVLFLTSIYGTYERTLKSPEPQSFPSRFVAFTDRDDLKNSPGWEVHIIKDVAKYDKKSVILGRNDLKTNRHPFNFAKFFKQQFHTLDFLRGHRVAVWIDGTIHIKNGSTAEMMNNLVQQDGRNFILFEHERNGIVEAEVEASLFPKYTSTHWGDHDQPFQDVQGQFSEYQSFGFKEKWWLDDYDAPLGVANRKQYGLWVTCFIAFDMASPTTHIFLDTWWQQNVEYTTQDQVSFPFVAWKLQVYPFSLPVSGFIEGSSYQNDLFYKLNHGLRRL